MNKVAPKPHVKPDQSNFSPQKMEKLCAIATRVFELSGVSVQYLIASMYVESTFNPNAKNGEARGIAQIKPGIWRETIESDLFKEYWKEMSPGKEIPKTPGKMVEADVLAMAVITRRHEDECDIREWSGRTKDLARRLCYHLKMDTAFDKLKTLKSDGQVAFAKPKKCVKSKGSKECGKSPNQKNWDRFMGALDTAKLVCDLTNMGKLKWP